MKNRNKALVLTVVLLILSCLMALTACGEPEVTDIAVSQAPRTTYVRGQDIDVSHGVLTVMVDGEATSVPFDAEGVTVTGYNKDQLGKQTLTVTYKEKTTTYEVTVVERMVAENYETSYFVGDTFDNSKGRLKITKDDGTTETVNLNSPSVVPKFNFNTVGDTTVTVEYTNASGTIYETDFTVKVYGIGEVTINRPTKTVYQSHETEISLAGGYFTVKADGLDTLSKFIPITEDMVSGFNPALATAENRKTPLKQTITYTYAGKSFEQEITVTYSAISIMEDAAKALKDLDFSGETVDISDEQGEMAMDAISEYLALTQAKKKLLSVDTIRTVVLPAAVYAKVAFYKEVANYSETFAIDPTTGQFLLIGTSYEKMAEHNAKLADKNELINVYADLLRKMDEEFKDMNVKEDLTVGDFIVIATEEDFLFVVESFKFLMELHTTLDVVPTDWEIEDLADYESDINTAVYLIHGSNCIGPQYDYIFKVLANWRENNDYFDIIYSYYFYVAENGEDSILQLLWQKLPLPGKLQDWYVCLYNASYQAEYMKAYAQDKAYLHDTTSFMYYYFETARLAEEIKNGEDELCRELYKLINGDLYFDNSVRLSATGYITNVGPYMKSDAFLYAWEQYLKLIGLVSPDGLKLEENAAEYEAAFNSVANLSPAELFGFINSLKFLYSNAGGEYLAFDYANGASSQFVFYVSNYYVGNLSEDARPLFQQLLLVMENTALHFSGVEADAYTRLTAAITALNDGYKALSQDDKDAFDALLGDVYSRYLGIYNATKGEFNPTLSDEAEAKFDELEATLDKFIEIFNANSANADATQEERNAAFVSMFALFEKATVIYNELLALDEEGVLERLVTVKRTVDEVDLTLEAQYGTARYYFVVYMINTYFTKNNEDGEEEKTMAWDVYEGTSLDGFFVIGADMFSKAFLKEALDKATVDATMSAFRQLDAADQWVFYMMAASSYNNALADYLGGIFGDDEKAKELVDALIEAEYYYVVYSNDTTDDEAKKNFTDKMASVVSLWNEISNTELRDANLGELYNYYNALYEELTEESEQPEQTA